MLALNERKVVGAVWRLLVIKDEEGFVCKSSLLHNLVPELPLLFLLVTFLMETAVAVLVIHLLWQRASSRQQRISCWKVLNLGKSRQH